MSEKEISQIIKRILREGETSLQPAKKQAELDVLNKWQDFESTTALKGRSGVGPGEDRLAEILGGEVQGQSESFDLEIVEGPFSGKWEVKAPDSAGTIRPGTEGITAFGPINKTLRNAVDELAEFLGQPGVDELAESSETKTQLDKIKSFFEEAVTKSGKTDAGLTQSGEITANRFEKIMDMLDAAAEMIQDMQGELLNVTVGEKEYQVTPTNMLKISRLLGMTDEEASGDLGEAAAAASALATLNSKVFEDATALRTQWEESIQADEVFDLSGIILVTPEGFMMIRKPYGDKIKFNRVTQGKPRFQTPLKGKSGSGVWGESIERKENIKSLVREMLISEELTKTDKKEVERLVRKGIERDRAEQKKMIRKELDDEMKKALGTSFFGYKGTINQFVSDEIDKRFGKGRRDPHFADTVEEICKEILKKFHRDMAIKYPQIVDRIKIR